MSQFDYRKMNIQEDIRISNYFVKDVGIDELLEWWATCDASHMIIEGREWFVLNLVGSPMTGSNCCEMIDEDGNRCFMSIPHFKEARQSLAGIKNSRSKL